MGGIYFKLYLAVLAPYSFVVCFVMVTVMFLQGCPWAEWNSVISGRNCLRFTLCLGRPESKVLTLSRIHAMVRVGGKKINKKK